MLSYTQIPPCVAAGKHGYTCDGAGHSAGMFLRILTNAECALRGLPHSLADSDSRLRHHYNNCSCSTSNVENLKEAVGNRK